MKRTPLKRKTRLKCQSNLKRTGLKKVSQARAKRERAKHKAYEEIDKKWDGKCKGCGESSWTAGPIHHSHLIPESVRADLAANEENLTFHCIPCHLKWEVNSPKASEMLDYRENLGRLRELDWDYYLKFKEKHNRNE
jgi:5-methylcytosine-specific restriction endonuclease McrA